MLDRRMSVDRLENPVIASWTNLGHHVFRQRARRDDSDARPAIIPLRCCGATATPPQRTGIMPAPVKTLVVGCGHMGTSHARAYHALADFEIVGVVARNEASRRDLLASLGADYPQFASFEQALDATRPDAVSINT
jgi:D-arabinose 1-dehydrogenase-like Zn-dependent alcohol dehydrogenase